METIIVDKNIYSLRSIFSTAYIFLDDFYIFLDQLEDNKITIKIKSKKEGVDLKKIVDDFKNELINCSLRLKISEENRKIREMIVSSALYGRIEQTNKKIINDTEGICKTWEEANKDIYKINDTEGICKSWQEIACHNEGVHKAVNKSCAKLKESNYVKMFNFKKEDGNKSE